MSSILSPDLSGGWIYLFSIVPVSVNTRKVMHDMTPNNEEFVLDNSDPDENCKDFINETTCQIPAHCELNDDGDSGSGP